MPCGRHLALAHFRQRSAPSRVWTGASCGRRSIARSTLLIVRQRAHWTSSQGKPPLIACPIVGEGWAGPPSLHIFSFHDWQARLSALRISASPCDRNCSDCSPRIFAIARDLTSSFANALRSPPDRGVGWCLGAMGRIYAMATVCSLWNSFFFPAPLF